MKKQQETNKKANSKQVNAKAAPQNSYRNGPEMKNGVGNDLANDNRKSDNNTTAADTQDM